MGILSLLLVLPLTVGTANAQIPQKKIDEAYAHAATALNQVLVIPSSIPLSIKPNKRS